MQVRITPEALEDIIAIKDYIGQFNPDAAMRIAEQLVETAQSLKLFPKRGRAIADGSFELVACYPFIIKYDLVGETVQIVGVRHGAQERP